MAETKTDAKNLTATRCLWCSVDVDPAERAELVPSCHHWCVAAVARDDGAHWTLVDRIIARRIVRAAARARARNRRAASVSKRVAS